MSSWLIPGEWRVKKRRILLREGNMTTSQKVILLVLPHVVKVLTKLAEHGNLSY